MENVNAVRTTALCVTAVAAAQAFAMRPAHADSTPMWAALLLVYAVLAGLWLRQGAPGATLRPRAGDLTVGVLVGLATVAGGFLGLRLLLEADPARQMWLFRLYAQAGDVQGTPRLLALLTLVVIGEEFVWRGWVLGVLRQVNPRFAAPLSALAYAVAHLPVYFTLRDPGVGGNPLVPLAALGCGLIWGYLTQATGRLIPTIIAHGVFTYFLSAPMPHWL